MGADLNNGLLHIDLERIVRTRVRISNFSKK